MYSAIASLEFSDASSIGTGGIKHWMDPMPRFALVHQASSDRREVETYIHCKFSESYGATLSHYLPLLVALRCGESLSGAAGVSLARQQPALFLEQYLDLPIEQELQRLAGDGVARQGIAEVGNLVATTRGASRLVFIVLASLLSQAGLDWMVFTATAPLQASLRKLGFTLLPIQAANPGRLPGTDGQEWGTYYRYAPQVVAGRLRDAQALIAERHVYSAMQALFQAQIDALAEQLQGVAR